MNLNTFSILKYEESSGEPIWKILLSFIAALAQALAQQSIHTVDNSIKKKKV